METWLFILNFIGAFGFGALFTNIVDRIINYKLQKKKFQFEKLYIRRAEIIEKTYKKLSKMHRAFQSLMAPLQLSGEPSREEKAKRAAELANDFIEYFDDNRIYFEKNLEQKINEINKEFREAWLKFQYATEEKINIEEWTNAWKKVKEGIPEIKEEIKQEFRKILGVQFKISKI